MLGGTFYHAERHPGRLTFTGNETQHKFVIAEVINSKKIIVQFAPDFHHYMVKVKENGITGLSLNNGVRTLTLRKDGNWVFMGYGKLYEGERIGFNE